MKEQWEALCSRATEVIVLYLRWPEWARSPDTDSRHHATIGLALFARLMSLLPADAWRRCKPWERTTPHLPVNMDVIEVVKLGPKKLHEALRRVHQGSDRGELKALLVEAWGPSTAATKDTADGAFQELSRAARGIASLVRGEPCNSFIPVPVERRVSARESCDRCGFWMDKHPSEARPVIDEATPGTFATPDDTRCVCKPGWGHKSDGPHPRERVYGCDVLRGQ